MDETITITDPQDERIADYRALTDLELRTQWEPPHGLFIAEGSLVLRRALRAGYVPRSILVDVKRVDEVRNLTNNSISIYSGTAEILQAITGFHVHRGILASFHRKPALSTEDILARATRIVICENINNHTNIGAIFRCAAAIGFDAVLLSASCADPLYRRSVRVSMGEVFAIDYARLNPWIEGLGQVRDAGFHLLALTPAIDAVAIHHLNERQRQKPAVLLGAEGPGLTPETLAASDVRVVIPMRSGVDSLNVAAAASIAFWELCRDMPV